MSADTGSGGGNTADIPAESGPETKPLDRKYPKPVTHGAGITYHYDDVGLYDEALETWRSEVGDPSDQPVTLAEYQPDFLEGERDLALRFKSSKWKAGREGPGGYRPFYKYHLTLKERVEGNDGPTWKTPEISLDIRIEPQVDGLVYPDGNELSLPFGEGTHVVVQTTYPDGPADVIERTKRALSEAFDYDHTAYRADSARITKLESHVRFDIEAKNRVVECLENSKRLIAYGGSSDLKAWQERTGAGWLEARVDSDRWDLLGFDVAPFAESMKVYQIGDWDDRTPDDPLHHPKLEAAYQGGAESHPPLSAWSDLSESLQHKVVQHCRWAGISLPELVHDPYYAGPSAPLGRYPVLDGRRDDLRAVYDDLRLPVLKEVGKDTRGPFDILSVVLEHSGADYATLVAETGLSRSTVRYHVRRFEELGFIERVSNPTWVFFEAPYVEDIVREIIEGWSPDTVARSRVERARRADERRDKRESKGDTDDADSDDDGARALFRYIEEVGISPDQISRLMSQGDLSGRDVRVRWDDSLEELAIG